MEALERENFREIVPYTAPEHWSAFETDFSARKATQICLTWRQKLEEYRSFYRDFSPLDIRSQKKKVWDAALDEAEKGMVIGSFLGGIGASYPTLGLLTPLGILGGGALGAGLGGITGATSGAIELFSQDIGPSAFLSWKLDQDAELLGQCVMSTFLRDWLMSQYSCPISSENIGHKRVWARDEQTRAWYAPDDQGDTFVYERPYLLPNGVCYSAGFVEESCKFSINRRNRGVPKELPWDETIIPDVPLLGVFNFHLDQLEPNYFYDAVAFAQVARGLAAYVYFHPGHSLVPVAERAIEIFGKKHLCACAEAVAQGERLQRQNQEGEHNLLDTVPFREWQELCSQVRSIKWPQRIGDVVPIALRGDYAA